MSSASAAALLFGMAVYAAAGAVFAVPFLLCGVTVIDPAARSGTRAFRLIILPGVVAFWPLLAWRWLNGSGPPAESHAHRRRARAGAPE